MAQRAIPTNLIRSTFRIPHFREADMNLANITRIGVVGAGTMGAGIAQVGAQRGYEVVLYDVTDEIARGAVDKLGATLRKLAERGKVSGDEAEAALARLTPASTLEAMADAQVIIEAAPERLELKQRIFGELEQLVAADAILATNTSTLSVTQIGAGTSSPGRVVGMHFFNPAPLMPLVEVISGAATEPAVADTIFALAEAMGKRPVRVQDVPGFIVNRVARPFHLEGLRLLERAVADPATIDRLYREGGGFKMGPFELQDLIGIDINFAASQSIYDAYFHAPRFRPSPLQRRQVESGNLGKKSGRGWFG
jgi:3-hydroxybutyryl-CoA dehydrogenase